MSDSKARIPRYELGIYRQFIRDAASYVSLIVGRRVKEAEAESLSDTEISKLALMIDERVASLKPLTPK